MAGHGKQMGAFGFTGVMLVVALIPVLSLFLPSGQGWASPRFWFAAGVGVLTSLWIVGRMLPTAAPWGLRLAGLLIVALTVLGGAAMVRILFAE